MSDYQVIRWNSEAEPKAEELRKIMNEEGYRVYQWSDRAGAVYAEHFHGNDQSHWIISGTLELTVKDCGTFVLKAGDRDLIPAKTYHSARVIGNEPVVYLIGEKN